MSTEFQNLVSSFRAVVTQEALNHRGADVGMVASFAKNVRDHQKRYGVKLDNLRAADGREQSNAAIDAVEAEITALANSAVSAAETAGRVEIAA